MWTKTRIVAAGYRAFAPCNNIPTMHANQFFAPFAKTALGLAMLAAGAMLFAATPTPMPPKPFRIIDAVCDVAESEISAQGQFVCRYVCRDPDQTKVSVVYSTSGSGQCRTPINRKIKQYFNPTP